MKYQVEDLGPQAFGDSCMVPRRGRNPRNGHEVALIPLSVGGFLVADPIDRTSLHVRPERCIPNGSWDAVGQAPDGRVYLTGVFRTRLPLFCWNWEGCQARVVAELPGMSFFSLDVALDGRVYLPEYGQNALLRFDPRSGRVESLGDFNSFGTNVHDAYCGPDGWVYLVVYDYVRNRQSLVAYDPRADRKGLVTSPDAAADAWPVAWAGTIRDADGRVLVPQNRWGRRHWLQAREGALREIDQGDVRLNPHHQPLAFRDGSYVSAIEDRTMTLQDRQGRTYSFELAREDSPLRIFSVFSGANTVWGSTFMPLTLFGRDLSTGRVTSYGNPTPAGGEIYSMAVSRQKLFMASYNGAHLDRLDPERPLRKGVSPAGNPAHLGSMKEEGLPLQRPAGVAMDKAGTVYFAAMGGYGCEDSGIARINPDTEEVTRWIFPHTTFDSLVYLPQLHQLLVSEVRKGETAIRFTFISPDTGRILEDRPCIEDQGRVASWLADDSDWVYGMHPHRATLFAYSLKERRIVKSIPEMNLGDNCNNCLIFGPDGRIWGLTVKCLFAAERDLSTFEKVADYEDHAGLNANRFGLCTGSDGSVYFPNGTHLMRIRGVR